MTGRSTVRRLLGARLLLGRLDETAVYVDLSAGLGALVLSMLAVAATPVALGPGPWAPWKGPTLAVLLVYPCLLLHALARARVGRRRGVVTTSITLHALAVSAEATESSRWSDELTIAAAGPALSGALSLAAFTLHRLAAGWPVASVAARDLARWNLWIAVVSLFPLYPSDGARLLGAVLWRARGAGRHLALLATASRRTGTVLLLVAAVAAAQGEPGRAAALGVGGALFLLSSRRAARAMAASPCARVRTVADVMVTDVVIVPAALSLAEVEREFASARAHPVFPVLRGDTVVGVLRRADVLRCPVRERDRLTAQAAMIRLHPYVIASPTDALDRALRRLHNRIGCLVVLDEGRLKGLVFASST